MNSFIRLKEMFPVFVQTDQNVIRNSVINSTAPHNKIDSNTNIENVSNVHGYSHLVVFIPVAVYLWLSGVIMISLFLLFTQYNIKSSIKSIRVADLRTLRIIEKIRKRLSIKSNIPLVIN